MKERIAPAAAGNESPQTAFLRAMPKAELHIHLEGAIQPATVLELAAAHGMLHSLPAADEDGLRRWFVFRDFNHFVEIYMTIQALLRRSEDFATIAYRNGEDMAAQGIRYRELTVTTFTHTHLQGKSISIEAIFAGLEDGRQQARRDFGVEMRWVIDIPRNASFKRAGGYDPFPAEITLAHAIAGMGYGVIGLGLGGHEVGAPPEPFAHVFAAAKAAGLRSLPHAGETVGPASIWGALKALGAERIGHGVRAIEDPALLLHLHERQIPLEINPTSNICLGVYPRPAQHPFPHLDRMGLFVTVNSDDPPLFNTSLLAEYHLLADTFGYNQANLARIARNAFTASYAEPELKRSLLAEFDAWIEDSQGTFQRALPITVDLQKSQESTLRAVAPQAQARDWLDTLVQSIAEGVVTFNSAGLVTFLNQTAAALTSFSPEEAIGRHVNDLFRVSEEGTIRFLDLLPVQGAKSRVAILGPGGESKPPKPTVQPGQRSPRRIRSTAGSTPKSMWEITRARLPGLGGDGKAAQTVLVLRDISETEALGYLRSYFLANITHEFRTPLSTLGASIDLLMEEADTLTPVEMRELLKPVHLSLLGLRTLIDNLLDSSTIEAGRFGIHKRPLDLDQVVAAGLQMVQPLLERRHQPVTLTAPAEMPPIYGDAARLTQVLVNLLTNASKYSPMGQPIEIVLEPHGDWMRIAIADQGAGIPPSERANLFRSFVRMRTQDAEQYGVGLGLYVVKTTVESHGGRVGVDDRPGGGSIFWFELPLNAREDVL